MTIPISQLSGFIKYVDSFYGVVDPLYPMTHKDTGLPLNTVDITRATLHYIDRCLKGDLEYVHYTWGDGDSLDRERVRDILLGEFDYVQTSYDS